MTPRSIITKIWDAHRVERLDGGRDLIAIDRNILHDLTVRIVVPDLEARGHRPVRPAATFAVPDHAVSTQPGRNLLRTDRMMEFAHRFRKLSENAGFTTIPVDDPRQGIVHAIGPEMGLTQPGVTLVCTDSHSSSHGALGALAWGIGTSDAAHVTATGMIVDTAPRVMKVRIDGRLPAGVYAKDVILALIARYGDDAGTGYAVEYDGTWIASTTIEERLTLCNMTVEFGARMGIVASDDRTFDYLAGREFAPSGADWDQAVMQWRALCSDPGTAYAKTLELDVNNLAPRVTFGTSVDQSLPVDGHVPHLSDRDAVSAETLEYMGLTPGIAIKAVKIKHAFIGSCTNGRLSDLVDAARILEGRKVHPGVRLSVVPSSSTIRREAMALGLDRVFLDAGAEWHEAGCSLCCAVNGDSVPSGERCIATSNRNFVGRQGPGAQTHLASPATVAASALAGHIADVREYLRP